MKFNTIQVISIIAIFQSLCMSLYFFQLKNGNRSKNNLLSAFFFCFAILMSASLSLTEGIALRMLRYQTVILLLHQAAFLIGPLLYLYVRASIKKNDQLERRDLVHGIPFLLSMIYLGIELASMDHFIIWLSILRLVNVAIILIHNLVYLLESLWLLRKTPLHPIGYPENSQGITRRWMLLIIFGTGSIWMIQLNSLIFLHLMGYYKYCPHMTSLYSASTFVFFNSVAYIVLTKPDLFRRIRKYEKSRLDPDAKQSYQQKLIEYMTREKPYLDPSLSLSNLARALSVPRRELSQIINESCHLHFYEFVNHYRIEESKQYLRDPDKQNETILEICYSVGFNSKSAFNTPNPLSTRPLKEPPA